MQLLLHHVIPGAFDVASLQDEMTGVSLAGTQLRVNQYDMHDVEWNEVRVTTINGARVLDDKKDIHIPQVISYTNIVLLSNKLLKPSASACTAPYLHPPFSLTHAAALPAFLEI